MWHEFNDSTNIWKNDELYLVVLFLLGILISTFGTFSYTYIVKIAKVTIGV